MKKTVKLFSQIGNYSEVWFFNEISEYKDALNRKIKYLSFILFLLFVHSVSGQIAFRATSNNTTTSTTLTIVKPAGLAVGDIMIAQVMQSGNNLASSIADATSVGWTRISGGAIGTTLASYSNVTLLYKFANSTDIAATNFTFDLKANSDDGQGAIIAFSGVDTSTFFDGTPGNLYTNINNDSQLNANSITTTTPDSVILMFGAVHDDNTFSNWTTTSPGTLTEIYDAPFNNANIDTAIGAAWGRKAVAGSTGGGTANVSGNALNGSILVALKAACVSNLIKNGDFSNSAAGNNNAANWSVGSVGSYVETQVEDTYFSTGNTIGYTAELDSESSIKQTGITVVPNVSYTVSFIYAQRPTAPTPTGVTVRVTGGGTFISSGIETSVRTPSVGTFTFTPTNSPITIDFYNSLNGGNTYGTIIDNIVLLPTSQVSPIAVTSGVGGSFNTSTACAGTPIQLNVQNVPATGVTYAWTGSAGAVFSSTTIQNPTITFTGSGLQYATVNVTTTTSGCSGTPSTTYVNVLPLPALTIVDPSAVCSPATVSITSAAVQTTNTGTTTKYYSTLALANAGGASDITTPSAIASSGTYYIRSEFVSGCYIAKPVTVTINPLPALTIVNPSAVCSPATVSITSATVQTTNTGTTTKYYSTLALANAGGASDITTPSAIASSGTYYIRSEFVSGCYIAKPVTVTINPLPALTIVNPSAVCSPATVSITSAAVQTTNTGTTTKYYSTLALANAGGASDITTPSAIASSGTYYIRSEFVSGCYIAKPVTVTINPLPALTIVDPSAVCSPATVSITSAAVQTTNTGTTTKYYSTLALANAGGASDITTPSAIASSGTYYIRSEFVSGCYIAKPVTVTINPLPALTIVDPSAVCSPATVSITSAAVQTTNTGTTTKYYSTLALANAGGASDITTPSAIASSGTYYIRSEFVSGCYIAKPVTVTINPLPALTIVDPSAVCSPATVSITSAAVQTTNTGTTTKYYSTLALANAGGASDITTPSAIASSGTYYIRSEFVSGCYIAKPVTVTINPLPALTIVDPSAVCSPATVSITSATVQTTNTGTTTKYYSTLALANAGGASDITTPSAIASSGTYYIRSEFVSGCYIAKPVTVTINPLPALTIVDPSAVCSPATVSITSAAVQTTNTGTTTKYYSTLALANAGGASDITTPSAIASSGTYYIRSEFVSGCYIAKPVTVTINPLPALTIVDPSAVCSPATVSITSAAVQTTNTGTTTKYYSTLALANAGGASDITTPSAIASSGTYYIRSEFVSGCYIAKPVTVTINPLPALTIVDPSAVCSPATVSITSATVQTTNTGTTTKYYSTLALANAGGASDITTPSAIASSGTYYIRSEFVSGCYIAKPVTVTINPLPALTIVNPSAVCSPATVSITSAAVQTTNTGTTTKYYSTLALANAGGASDITTPSAIASSGTYYIRSEFVSGCYIAKPVTVTINPLPALTIVDPSAVCSPATVSITSAAVQTTNTGTTTKYYSTLALANAGGASDITTPSAIASSGTYYIRSEFVSGCYIAKPVTVTINPLPSTPSTITVHATCAVPTGKITFTSPTEGSGFEYSVDGTAYVSTAEFSGLSVGLHTIKIRNSSGCEIAGTSVNINPASTKQWNGSVDSKWNTAANWTPTGIPAIGDCVEIPDTTIDPIIDTTNTNYNVHALTVNTNGSLTVGSTNTLTVTNAVTVLGSGATAGALIFENNSSLLQTNTASNINIGNITYKRDTAPLRHYDLTYWSSPVTATPGFTLSKLSPNTLRDKYYSYNSSTDLWVTEYDGLAVMAPGRGYNLRAPISFDVITSKIYKGEFVGVPNNGDVTLVTVPGKWSLGGNPYPSAINGRKFISDNGTKVGTIYFWTHTTTPTTAYPGDEKYNYNSDDFASMNLSGETAATTLLSSIPSTYIAAGVGFFFKAGPGTTVTYTNDMRVTGKNEQFFKTDQAEATDRSRVWLNLTNTQGAFKQLLVAYANGATNNWDANYDAQTLNGNSYIDFYSINGSTKLTIQGRALPFDNSDEVILGYKSVVASDFTIAIDHVDGLFTDQPVYLEDKVTGKIQNLTAGNYTFTTAIGTFTERFVLRYTNKTLGTGDLENLEDTLLVSVKDKAIKVTSSKETIKDVVIYDVSGKQLYDKKKIGTTELQISNLQSSNQVLLVKVTLENGFTTTRKIIFQ